MGRADEREVLRSLLGSAVAGAGAVVLVSGPGNMWCGGSGWRRVARMAVLTGRRPEAVTAFENALAADVGLGAGSYATHSRLGLADLLANDDPARARALATIAAAEARTIGLTSPLARADRLLRRLASLHPSPLTTREREVAELIAQSLSNREIAARLMISERTVETHARSILAKLGVTRRTDIVRWVLQQPQRL